VEYLETDVRITADGVCLAFHDAALARITGAEGKIANLTLAGVRRLGIGGESIPRIEDLLDAFPDARFVMDLKDSRALAPLIGLLRHRGDIDRVALAGARDRWLTAARTMAGGALSTALGWESTTRLVMGARAGRLPRGLARAEFVHVPWRLGRATVFSERLVMMAHELGLKVMVWTVDDPSTMHHLLDRGVDGIISNRPDVLCDVIAGRDKWRNPPMIVAPTLRRPLSSVSADCAATVEAARVDSAPVLLARVDSAAFDSAAVDSDSVDVLTVNG
jgi:glycerophosphoryl diester phosphodiesterase